MFKDVLASIAGIDVVPIVLLCLFVVFFSLMIAYVLKIDKNAIKRYAELPFEKPVSPLKRGE
ncbi:MAG: cbb3-type cytochrome c oxidase subunit 3 [Calditrichaeota bacterium]|nr:MAG: cbb3-type cytochrome c oxidase subunit 3 [Calditrichota bacterium]